MMTVRPVDPSARRNQGSDLFRVLAEDPDQGLFLLDDKSLGFGFLCQPLSGLSTGLFDRLNVLLNQEWPVDTLIQCLLFTSPDVPETANAGTTPEQLSPLPRRLDQRSRAFRMRATEHPLPELDGTLLRKSELILTFKLPLKQFEPSEGEVALCHKLQGSAFQASSPSAFAPHPSMAPAGSG